MAGAIRSAAVAAKIQGLREAKAAFQALPAAARERLNVATDLTIREIARQAKARILSAPSVQTRTLYNSVAFKMNPNNGRGKVGITPGQTIVRTNQTSTGQMKTIRIKGVIGPGRRGKGTRVIRPVMYAHHVEFGTVHMKAEPFMIPSVETEKPFYVQRCQGVWRLIEGDLAKIGGGVSASLSGSRTL